MTIMHFEGYNCTIELDTEQRTVTLNHSGMATLRAKKKASPRVIAFDAIEAIEHKSGALGGTLRILRHDRDGYKRTIANDFNAFQEKPGHPVAAIADKICTAVGLPVDAEPELPSHEAPAATPTHRLPHDRVLAKGAIGSGDFITIYQDGTFTTGQWNPNSRDRLIGFSYESDSMRRKSVTGRTAAALVSGGYSLAASNNRGVLYVTVVGLDAGPHTYTTRNPSNVVLTSVRDLKAVVDSLPRVTKSDTAEPAPAVSAGLPAQLATLAELHAAGALSDSEFVDAKRRLLS